MYFFISCVECICTRIRKPLKKATGIAYTYVYRYDDWITNGRYNWWRQSQIIFAPHLSFIHLVSLLFWNRFVFCAFRFCVSSSLIIKNIEITRQHTYAHTMFEAQINGERKTKWVWVVSVFLRKKILTNTSEYTIVSDSRRLLSCVFFSLLLPSHTFTKLQV